MASPSKVANQLLNNYKVFNDLSLSASKLIASSPNFTSNITPVLTSGGFETLTTFLIYFFNTVNLINSSYIP